MNRKLGKTSAYVMSFALLTSLLAGCTSSATQPTNSPSKNEEAISSIPLPIVSKPITLKMFVSMDPKVAATMKNYNEIAQFKELEKRTGIHIDFIHPASMDAAAIKEQFNLMIASGDLPDLIYYNWINDFNGGPNKAIKDGIILPLNDLVDKYSPNLKKFMSSDPKANKQLRTDDGTLYVFPEAQSPDQFAKVNPNPNPAFQTFGWQIRQDWLEKLKLKSPETIDDWYEVLTAFKTKNPSGSGKNDEIPLAPKGAGDLQNWVRAWGINYGFYHDGDTVKFGPYTPEYKEALTTLAKWYKEGLIDPDFGLTDAKQFDTKVTGNRAGAWTGATSGTFGRFVQLMKAKDPSVKLLGTVPPYVKGTKSYNFNADEIKVANGIGVAISAKSKYAKEAAMWLDYGYSPEGALLNTFGIEGESYKMVNGSPQLLPEITNNPKGLSIDEALSKYSRGSGGLAYVMTPEIWHQRMSLPEQQQIIGLWKAGSYDRIMPPVTPTVEESTKMASVMSAVNTYKDEQFLKMVMGQTPISEFDNYIKTLKGMGVEDAIKIQQAAYERYVARK
ncbi:putative aldouronate transport system substrate-binding protein [Paenibacillus sp. 1_12]|uniref:extracellular solute-binding protein n=1 Tax=Paenibacillus sp. 1_12 TaxID=1566278 RepID=UPI0008DEAE74|nr:extracellular solute-binding protein [Paenibacillus sp. 1_12]SFK99082.1 putative aldouronate transport system substrate-binding protein [Paenibacillus sp. 1_12]